MEHQDFPWKRVSDGFSIPVAVQLLYLTEGYLSLLHVFQIVEREVISYGSQDACRIEAHVSWALPYAQRYMLQHHNEHYNSLENSHFAEEVKKLQCVVVDQLYFRYTLQSGRHCSRSRLECGAILQVCFFLPIFIQFTPLCSDKHSHLGIPQTART